jgi:hypothetical protein
MSWANRSVQHRNAFYFCEPPEQGEGSCIVYIYYSEVRAMSRINGSQAASKNELCEKLRDLVSEKQQVQEQIRETEKQIDRLQNNTKSSRIN